MLAAMLMNTRVWRLLNQLCRRCRADPYGRLPGPHAGDLGSTTAAASLLPTAAMPLKLTSQARWHEQVQIKMSETESTTAFMHQLTIRHAMGQPCDSHGKLQPQAHAATLRKVFALDAGGAAQDSSLTLGWL